MALKKQIADSGVATKQIVTVPMSFETGEQAATKIFFPRKVRITKILGIATLVIAGTDAGTITGANATGNSTAGVLTYPLDGAINLEKTATPTTNNTVVAGSYYKLTAAKSTAGGKVLVTLQYQYET